MAGDLPGFAFQPAIHPSIHSLSGHTTTLGKSPKQLLAPLSRDPYKGLLLIA